MKFKSNPLRPKLIVLDKSSESSLSDIDESVGELADVEMTVAPVVAPPSKLRTIVSIRKQFEVEPHSFSHPIKEQEREKECFIIEDEENHPKHFDQNQMKIERKCTEFKRKLVKLSNKCKMEGKEVLATDCSICLSSLSEKHNWEIGRLSCKHAFCFECIWSSSKFSNKCPYCRAMFHHIDKDGEHVILEDQPQQFEEEDEPCYVCGRDDDYDRLLECEYCEAAFCHTYCDSRLNGNSALPEGSWYCLSCSALLENSD